MKTLPDPLIGRAELRIVLPLLVSSGMKTLLSSRLDPFCITDGATALASNVVALTFIGGAAAELTTVTERRSRKLIPITRMDLVGISNADHSQLSMCKDCVDGTFFHCGRRLNAR